MQPTAVDSPKTIPHDVKVAKQVRQIHKAVVKPEPAQWPPKVVHDYADQS